MEYSRRSCINLLMEYSRSCSKLRFALGLSYDEPKTWESLVLGTVPILIRHPYAHAYAGLPVVLIDRFEEITQANLEVWYRKFAPLLNDPVRLQALLDPEAGWSKILAATPGASRHDGASAFTREGQGTAGTSSPSSGACGMSENGVEAYVFVRFQGGMANTRS